MSENIITWNWTNWLTVGLMGLAFFAVIGFVGALAAKAQA